MLSRSELFDRARTPIDQATSNAVEETIGVHTLSSSSLLDSTSIGFRCYLILQQQSVGVKQHHFPFLIGLASGRKLIRSGGSLVSFLAEKTFPKLEALSRGPLAVFDISSLEYQDGPSKKHLEVSDVGLTTDETASTWTR